MEITVNGKVVCCEPGTSVRALVLQLELEPESVVVERNRELVPGEQFASTVLEEGDVLEILHFVGGG